MFGVSMLLPCLVSAVFNILPFFLTSLTYSIYTLLSNVIIQAIFLQEMVNSIPLAASRVPKSVLFYSMTMLCNMFSLILHIMLVAVEQQSPNFVLRPVVYGLGNAIAVRLPFPPKSPIVTLRTTLGLFVSLLYIIFIFAFLIF
nr:unnamed protein product [Haemonchus contortus]